MRAIRRPTLQSPEEDDAWRSWAPSISKEWADELADPRQDIYTLEDGQPLDAPR